MSDIILFKENSNYEQTITLKTLMNLLCISIVQVHLVLFTCHLSQGNVNIVLKVHLKCKTNIYSCTYCIYELNRIDFNYKDRMDIFHVAYISLTFT